jgi:hypothetical protein
MNRLERLRDDVLGTYGLEELTEPHTTLERIIDKFCAEYEVVEGWDDESDVFFRSPRYTLDGIRGYTPTTILVPRKVPTLLEVQTSIVAAWDDNALTVRGRHCEGFAKGMDALRAAIKTERAR